MKVWYLPLEPYRERYTEHLVEWTVRAYQRRGVDHEVIHGQPLLGAGRVGGVSSVLNPAGRSHYAATQVAQLVARAGEVRDGDWVYLEDLFTPGYEAIPYVFEQLGVDVRVAARNHAQSVDPDDFTFAMIDWMRRYEEMVDRTADAVFVGATVLKEMWEAAGLGVRQGSALVHVVGHAFDRDHTLSLGPPAVLPWGARPRRVVYSSRFDREKQPHFFMDMVERVNGELGEDVEFVVCSGADEVRSNDESAARRLVQMATSGILDARFGLTKRDYYGILAGARVQLNTARQDFVSYTAVEASAFAVPTLAPAFRSFPEALENRETQLYVPWSLDEAVGKLLTLLERGEPRCTQLAYHHHATLDRIIDVLCS